MLTYATAESDPSMNISQESDITIIQNTEERRSKRTNKEAPPNRFGEWINVITKLKSLSEALTHKNKKNWIDAMKDEIDSLERNQT